MEKLNNIFLKRCLALFLFIYILLPYPTVVAQSTDRTPPATPIVIDDGDFTNDKTQLHARWESTDPESGISEYQYAIGTFIGGTDIVYWRSAGLGTSVTHKGLNLKVGQIYYFSVKAKNGSNLWSRIGSSDGITVLNNPPQITSLLPADNSTFTEKDVINIEVRAQDPDGDPLEYRYLVEGNIIQDWTTLNTYTWQTQSGDIFLKTITVEAKDSYGDTDSKETNVFLYRKASAP